MRNAILLALAAAALSSLPAHARVTSIGIGFNDAVTGLNDPTAAGDAGNGFLMKQGYTIVWSGWQGDVPAGGGRMTATLPIATNGGAPIVGRNRDELIFDNAATSFTVALSYPAATLDVGQVAFTFRTHERDPRPSVEERYPTHEAYVAAAARSAWKLVLQRLLLPEDAEAMVNAAQSSSVGAH